MLWVLTVSCLSPVPIDTVEIGVFRLSATAASSPFVASVLEVTVEGATAEEVWVAYDLKSTYDRRGELTQRTASFAPGEPIAVLGLKSNTPYVWQAVSGAADVAEERSPPGTFTPPPPPSGVSRYDLVRRRTDRSALGFVLVSVARIEEDLGWVGILDRDADWVWWVATPPGSVPLSARLGLDGTSVLWGEFEEDRSESALETARAVRVSLDGQVRTETRLPLGHHDFVEHPDGTLGYLAYVTGEAFEDVKVPVLGDQIAEVPEGASEPLPDVVFDVFEANVLTPLATCTHHEETREVLGETVLPWTQANSLLFVDDEDAYYVQARFADALLKINRLSGLVQWQLNGLDGAFALPGGSPVWVDEPASARLWSHGHISQLWPGGMLVFDNGDHRTGASKLVQVEWREQDRHAWVSWSFAHPDGGFTPSMGDAVKVPGGNVISAWAGLGDIIEVQGDAIVWRAIATRGDVLGRVTWLDALDRPTVVPRGQEPLPDPRPTFEPIPGLR